MYTEILYIADNEEFPLSVGAVQALLIRERDKQCGVVDKHLDIPEHTMQPLKLCDAEATVIFSSKKEFHLMKLIHPEMLGYFKSV